MSGHSAHAPDDLPRAIGRYRIEARLDRSSTEDVYRGFDPNIERPVVIKVFHLDALAAGSEAEAKQAFYQEMQRTGLLMHHGIAALFDAGEQSGKLFTATEFVDGDSLATRLAHGITWDLQGRASILIQMLDALNFACELGVPHLNLKPGKVVIGPGHSLKVGGFGAGMFLNRLAEMTGAPLPASKYAAPERAHGHLGDQRADVYSAGLIARELLLSADGEAPAYLKDHAVQLDELRAVLAKAAAAAPAHRYATPEALKVDLLLALGVSDSTMWFEGQDGSTHSMIEAAPEAQTILTPSGVYVLPDNALTVVAPVDVPIDGDAPTMMQPSAKPTKSD